MSQRKACPAVAAAVAAAFLSVPVSAQAQSKPEAVELPAIVVTTTSPVVKPSKKKGTSGAKGP